MTNFLKLKQHLNITRTVIIFIHNINMNKIINRTSECRSLKLAILIRLAAESCIKLGLIWVGNHHIYIGTTVVVGIWHFHWYITVTVRVVWCSHTILNLVRWC